MEATLTSQEMVANKQRAVYNLSEDEKALKGKFLNPIRSNITLTMEKERRKREARGNEEEKNKEEEKKALVAPLVFIISR